MTVAANDDLIAARSAESRKVSKSPFGPDDEIGMMNLMTPQSRARVMAEADGSKMFDLAVEYFHGMPSWTAGGDPPYQLWMTHTPGGELANGRRGLSPTSDHMVYTSDAFSMFTHCGTHIDTLNHYGYDGQIWNCYSMAQDLGSRSWHVCGAEKHPPIFARGVLIDVARALGVDMLPDSHGIGADDLRAALDRQGTKLLPGDVVLVRTGRMTVWPEFDAYLINEPGLNLEGARFLAEAGAMVIGGDNVGLEQLPSAVPDDWIPVHSYLLAESGVPIMEVVNCEELSEAELYEFAFFAATIPLRGATGAPLRPVVFPLLS
jgi:kynurenine formamidase